MVSQIVVAALVFAVGVCQFESACATVAAASDVYNALEKADLTLFTKALDAADYANAISKADARGRYILIECAKQNLPLDFTALALEYGASASAKEASTGKTALHYAFANLNAATAQLLLAWGANPDVEDKEGVTARSLGASKPLAALLHVLGVEGPMAFEDPPGTWLKGKVDGHALPYYFNRHSNASVWRSPPSCAWQPTQMSDGRTVYVNAVTQQTVWRLPSALAWRRVANGDAAYWFNFRTNGTQSEEPGELPAEMIKNPPANEHYWVNSVTGEASWEEPILSPWIQLADPDGNKFFYNERTQESVWEAPAELAWTEVFNEEHNRTFWFNQRTNESQWTPPAAMAWAPRPVSGLEEEL